jgi:hypothetical protein
MDQKSAENNAIIFERYHQYQAKECCQFDIGTMVETKRRIHEEEAKSAGYVGTELYQMCG